jgi:hypothetical protein
MSSGSFFVDDRHGLGSVGGAAYRKSLDFPSETAKKNIKQPV